jgi:hypothetical protein
MHVYMHSKSQHACQRKIACQHTAPCPDVSQNSRMRDLAAFATPRSLQDLVLNKPLLSLFSFIFPLPAFSRPGSQSLGDTRYEGSASGSPSLSLGHRASVAAKTPSTIWSVGNREEGCGLGRESDGEAFACDDDDIFICSCRNKK